MLFAFFLPISFFLLFPILLISLLIAESSSNLWNIEDNVCMKRVMVWASVLSFGQISLLTSAQVAHAGESIKPEAIYEVGELFELGIQLSYLLLLLALLGVGTFFVIRQVLTRRDLDLSAKELQASSSFLICIMLSKSSLFLPLTFITKPSWKFLDI